MLVKHPPGDTRSHGISSNSIYLAISEYFSFSTTRFNVLIIFANCEPSKSIWIMFVIFIYWCMSNIVNKWINRVGNQTCGYHNFYSKMSTLLALSQGNSHYNDIIMSAMASQITSLTIIYSTFYSGADQRKHKSLAFVRGIHPWPVYSPHKGPVTKKMFPFGDIIMWKNCFNTIAADGCLVNIRSHDIRSHDNYYRKWGNFCLPSERILETCIV